MTVVTIVTYHYVRPLAGSRYPRIKGLELDRFVGQLEHLDRYHRFVTVDEVVEAMGGAPLPERPVLLTFDDGYTDHIRHVAPVLRARGIQGAFFPPSEAVLERRMLAVNKIHFVLASVDDPSALVASVEAAIESARPRSDLLPLDDYRAAHRASGRWDPPEVVYVKRLLQQVLPADLRASIVDELFRRHVSEDERGFADDLYVSVDDLRSLVADGMHVGGHGHAHAWLDEMDEQDQADDIDRSLELLAAVGLPTGHFTFCYPYGRRSSTTIELLRARGCVAGFTTELGQVRLPVDEPLELPRVDTNDLPTDPAAAPSSWTVGANR